MGLLLAPQSHSIDCLEDLSDDTQGVIGSGGTTHTEYPFSAYRTAKAARAGEYEP